MKSNSLMWCIAVAALLTIGGCKRQDRGNRYPTPDRRAGLPERVTVDSDDCLRRAIAWGRPVPGGSYHQRRPFTDQQAAVMRRVALANDREISRRVLARVAEIEADAARLEKNPPLPEWASVFGTGRLACARSAWCQELWGLAGPELVALEGR